MTENNNKEFSTMRRIIKKTIISIYEKLRNRLQPSVSLVPHKLSLFPESLLTLSQELQTDSRQVEADFLRLGRELQKTHEDASALISSAHDTVVMVNGEGDEGLLNQVERVAHDVPTTLHACRDSVCRDVGLFAMGAELMGDLYNLCRTIDKMVMELRMVGLNIGVESARNNEARKLFGLVASDVRGMSKKIASIAQSISGSALGARDIQLKAHHEISNDIGRMTAVATEAEKTVKEAALDIKNLMAMSTAAMNRISEHSREISNCIGNVVAEIQFHDNMNQRIAHITEALEELANSRRDDMDRNASRTYAIIDLQSAQLKQVIREVERPYRKILAAFDEISRHVAELSQNISCFQSEADPDFPPAKLSDPFQKTTQASLFQQEKADAKQLFLKLHNAIERFIKLLQQGYRLQGNMQKTFDYAASSANRLSDAAANVRKINFEIHILALNAIVKASHMGSEGTALEVLAHAVKGLSDQSNGFVMRMEKLLNDITATAQTGNYLQGIDDVDNAALNESYMKDGSIDILSTFEKINKGSMDIVTGAEALTLIISTTREGLTFLSDLKNRLDQRLLELESIKNTVHFFLGKKEEVAALKIERLKSRYTMSQERIVHGNQTKEKRIFHPIENDASVSEADDGIELFDTTCSHFGTPEPEKRSDGLGENVELF